MVPAVVVWPDLAKAALARWWGQPALRRFREDRQSSDERGENRNTVTTNRDGRELDWRTSTHRERRARTRRREAGARLSEVGNAAVGCGP
jgi:hypothetical protein